MSSSSRYLQSRNRSLELRTAFGCPSNSTKYSANGCAGVLGRTSLTMAVSPWRRGSTFPIFTLSPLRNAIFFNPQALEDGSDLFAKVRRGYYTNGLLPFVV